MSEKRVQCCFMPSASLLLYLETCRDETDKKGEFYIVMLCQATIKQKQFICFFQIYII